MCIATKENVYLIIPIHNRKFITIQCLGHLKKIDDLNRYSVIVVDDGSTDGTSAAVGKLHPEVKLLYGDGNLWWTGTIKKGMEYAYKEGAEYFIWLNDDTLPFPGAIASLVKACQANPNTIAAAQCYSSADLQIPTYGGQKRQWLKHISIYAAFNKTAKCDSLAGNLVCLPRSVVDTIGYPPDNKSPHYQGDSIYTWQAKQAGYELEVIGNSIAICEHNPGDPSWLTSDVPIAERWRSLKSPKSPFYPPGYWYFCVSFWGVLGILVFVKPYLRLMLISLLRWIVPRSLLKHLKPQIQV